MSGVDGHVPRRCTLQAGLRGSVGLAVCLPLRKTMEGVATAPAPPCGCSRNCRRGDRRRSRRWHSAARARDAAARFRRPPRGRCSALALARSADPYLSLEPCNTKVGFLSGMLGDTHIGFAMFFRGHTTLACHPCWKPPICLQGPRLCEYTGLLYCHSCHTGTVTAILPARVLHKCVWQQHSLFPERSCLSASTVRCCRAAYRRHAARLITLADVCERADVKVLLPPARSWDFSRRPVSDVAADFLASIATQPLLCIGAVNPGLYAGNPALARAHELRARVVKALAVARSKGAPAKVRRVLWATCRTRLCVWA